MALIDYLRELSDSKTEPSAVGLAQLSGLLGEDCETLNVEPINWPVRLTVYVDNGAGGREALQNMREGLKLFVDALPEEVEVGLRLSRGDRGL